MSAFSHTDWTVCCDFDDCSASLVGAELATGPDPATATQIRRILRKRGWAVAVPDDMGYRKRRDFCPDHKPKEA